MDEVPFLPVAEERLEETDRFSPFDCILLGEHVEVLQRAVGGIGFKVGDGDDVAGGVPV